jgi:hypothetical protein
MALSISKAWDETKAILARDGRLIGAVALALFVLPGLILDLMFPDTPPATFPKPGPWMGVAFVVGFLSLAGQLALIRLAMGPQLTVAEAILHGIRRFPSYFGAVLIWLLPIVVAGYALVGQIMVNPDNPKPAVALGLIVLTVVLAYFSVRFSLNSAVASAEAAGPLTILRRSWALTAGHWWKLFAFVFLFGIAVLALLFAVEAVTGIIAKLALGGMEQGTVGGLLVALASQLVSAAAYSTFFVMLARIYVQLAGKDARAGVPNSGT